MDKTDAVDVNVDGQKAKKAKRISTMSRKIWPLKKRNHPEPMALKILNASYPHIINRDY